MDEDINLPLLEKIKLIDTLDEDEKNALFKMIDLAISNKKMKDNLQQLLPLKTKMTQALCLSQSICYKCLAHIGNL
jgi:hypothetical protein